jgi:hypothetical protein
MNIFESINKFLEMGNDPRLMGSAESIGKAAGEIPALLKQLVDLEITNGHIFCDMRDKQHETNVRLFDVVEELRGMRMDLDRLGDPIQRPPFSPADVASAMTGNWPPENEFNLAAKEVEQKVNDGETR